MEPSPEANFEPKQERTFLEEQRAILEQTEGWGRMTRKQQTMILASLILQMRAIRETDDASAHLIQKITSRRHGKEETITKILNEKDFHTKSHEERGFLDRRHRLSQDMVSELICHQAVVFLEQENVPSSRELMREKSPQEKKKEKSDLWYRYFAVSWKPLGEEKRNTLEEKISEVGLPSVVYLDTRTVDREYIGHPPIPIGANHSFVVLGKQNEETIAWEKIGKEYSFRVTSLREILRGYPHVTHFAVRKLRNKKDF